MKEVQSAREANLFQPDPGPRLVDCTQAEANYTFYDPPLWTFEELAIGVQPPQEPLARGMYSYTDNSTVVIPEFRLGLGAQLTCNIGVHAC